MKSRVFITILSVLAVGVFGYFAITEPVAYEDVYVDENGVELTDAELAEIESQGGDVVVEEEADVPLEDATEPVGVLAGLAQTVQNIFTPAPTTSDYALVGDDGPLYDDEVWVYETEVDGPSDCTSVETYDPETQVCYFECVTDAECADLEAAVDAELAGLADDYAEQSYIESDEEINSDLIAKYRVANEAITLVSGASDTLYSTTWEQFARIAPDSISNKYIEYYEVMDDSRDDTLAYVHDEDANGKWNVGINFGTYGQDGQREDILTLVHELMHIITLNRDEMNTNGGYCATYESYDGCARSDSYLWAFISDFWSDEGFDDAARDPDRFYEDDTSRFVTAYAATSVEEDIAESFAIFIVDQAPSRASSEADQKVLFFYNYPELVSMRSEIRAGLGGVLLERKR
jgi:hypothetical protein